MSILNLHLFKNIKNVNVTSVTLHWLR